MRLYQLFGIAVCVAGLCAAADAAVPKGAKDKASPQVEVSADKSLEYYEDKKLYVARGNAKAIRGTMVITADLLTAHERDKGAGAKKTDDKNGSGDIDLMTAEGNVVIMTGGNLRYETAKEVVTAHNSLEYYEDTKLAVARGRAVADQEGRHIEGDVLSAQFRDAPNGQTQLSRMIAQGNVTVVTKDKNKKGSSGDVSYSNKAVYDAGSNVAIISGDVRVTRKDGTQLSGDVGEVDFNKNENRLLNSGRGRVRALLPSKPTDKTTP